MIEFKEVHKRFGDVVAVDNISISIAAGQLVGVLGPNGAGKTTMLRLLVGTLCPDRGSINVDGLNVEEHRREVAEKIGYLCEGGPGYGEMSAGKFLRFRLRIKSSRKLKKVAVASEVKRVADVARISDILHRPLRVLSRGYRQRVALADSLLGDPKVLVLDEPLVGLDPMQTKEFRDLIAPLKGKKTVLFSSHRLLDMEKLAERLVMVSDGKIVGDGSAEQLREQAFATADDDIEDVFVRLATNSGPAGTDGVQQS